MKRLLFGLIIVCGALIGRLAADEPAAQPPAAQPPPPNLRPLNRRPLNRRRMKRRFATSVKAYVEAFNKHDAKALADMWSPDAVYLNRVTGEEVVGRDAIAKQFTAMFKDEPDVKLTAQTESVQFISPNVAEEHGNSTVTVPKGEPEEVPYSAVYVKRDGQWLLDRVTDEAKEASESHYEQLKPLEWMVGHWVDKDADVDVETDCNWTKNRTFLTRSFTVSVDGESRHVGDADHRLGCRCEKDSLLDVRFRWRLRRSDLDVQERPLVRHQQGSACRRPQGVDDQRDQAD